MLTRSSSALSSVRMPATFFPRIKISFGHLISGVRSVSDNRAAQRGRRATVNCVASCGRRSGRSRMENHSPLPRRRNPFASQPSAAFGLRFGENDGAFLHSVARELFDDVVGGSGFLEDADVAADNFAFCRAREQIVGVQNVRGIQQPIAEMRAGFDVVTELSAIPRCAPRSRRG